jgi:ribosomal protein S18 acetylase RimI-like enzyme
MSTGAVQRPYRDDADFWRMRRFLQAAWRLTGPDGKLLHVGDLTWIRYQHTRDVMPPEERIRLWVRPDGELAGFAWYYPKSAGADLQIDPAISGSDEWRAIAAEMIDFAVERHAVEPDPKARPLSIFAPAIDQSLIAALEARGFTRDPESDMRFHRQSLAKELPAVSIPDGFAVRPVREDELEERVAIHREVWHPSKVTLESYKQLRAAPGYDPELDIVAVAPDGTMAAYAICWHDELNRSGEFEPVGAREAFRGRGLAKAVLIEAMRRLQVRGCQHAYVYTDEERLPAVALYRSAGFDLIYHWLAYRRERD